jgi:hypothetical protein
MINFHSEKEKLPGFNYLFGAEGGIHGEAFEMQRFQHGLRF